MLDILRDFNQVNPEQLTRTMHAFYSNPLMRLLHEVCQNNLLSGLITFEVNGVELDEPTTRTLNMIWRPFVMDAIRSHWCWGLVVVGFRQQESGYPAPVVLDLRRVKVYQKHHLIDATEYVFVDQSQVGLSSLAVKKHKAVSSRTRKATKVGDALGDVPVENLLVFETDPPASDGTLTSKVMTLLPEFDRLATLRQVAKNVLRYIERAVLVTEKLPAPSVTDDTTMMAMPAMAPNPLEGVDLAPIPATRETMQQDERARAMAVLKNNGMSADLVSGGLLRTEAESVACADILHLPTDRKFAGQVTRTELKTVVEMQQAHEETVGAILGVPRSYWAMPTSSRSSNSEGNATTFQNSLQALKSLIIPILNTTFAANYGSYYANQIAWTHAPFIMSSTDILNVLEMDALLVDINLSGIPPFEMMWQLYSCDLLKPEKFCMIIANATGLPLRYLNTSPEIGPRDLLGLQPTETEVTTSSSENSSATQLSKATTTTQKTVQKHPKTSATDKAHAKGSIKQAIAKKK